jgi:hypothetical protein
MRNGLIINKSGNKCYYLNNKLHREDGPAVEYSNGDKIWLQNGLYHRLDGPAVEYADGDVSWYFHDKYIHCISQEEFEEQIKLAMFW